MSRASRAFMSCPSRDVARVLFREGPLVLTQHELCLDGELVATQAHGLSSQRLGHAGELEHHASRLDYGDPAFGVALAGAHAGLRGLLGHGLVRKDVDPDLAAAL